MKKQDTDVKMIAQTTIISEHGWTKTLINKYLPEPKLVKNPHYSCAAPMKLWEETVVLAVMETPEFKVDMEKAERRRAGGKKAAEVRFEQTMEKVEEDIANIQIIKLGDKQVEQEALNNKYWYESSRGNDDACSVFYADDRTIDRWVVNFIRHNLVRYDSALEENKGKVGCSTAYYCYRGAVLDEIAKVYPAYAEECKRQKDSMYSRWI